MKHIIILGDGMADWPAEILGNKTLLEYANTPNLDKLARIGRSGQLITVAPGFHPGSEVANMSILGYNLNEVYEGRGVLEAANIGIDLQPGDMAMRCNLIQTEGNILRDYSAGHISTEEASSIINFLNQRLSNSQIKFYTGVQYRHVLVIKGGNKFLSTTPPHDIPLQPLRPHMVKALTPEAEATATILNELIIKSQGLLSRHPVNRVRMRQGKNIANSIWPWSPGYRPQMETLQQKYPSIHNGDVISAVDLINGIGYYAGLNRIKVEGATGLYNTNYENKVETALKALRKDDFVYLHIEASDEAGHEGDFKLKQLTIENLDKKVVGPILHEIETWNEPVAISVMPDHPTPCQLRTHTAEPVPFTIYYPGIMPDNVETYSEKAAQQGAYGLLKENQFMDLFMNL